jgi:hypothetical protein
VVDGEALADKGSLAAAAEETAEVAAVSVIGLPWF